MKLNDRILNYINGQTTLNDYLACDAIGKSQFNKELLHHIEAAQKTENKEMLERAITAAYYDGASNNYTPILVELLDAKWVSNKEDILDLLGGAKDCEAAPVFMNMIDQEIPGSFGSHKDKCIHALSIMDCELALIYLEQLTKHEDPRVSENAKFVLKRNDLRG